MSGQCHTFTTATSLGKESDQCEQHVKQPAIQMRHYRKGQKRERDYNAWLRFE